MEITLFDIAVQALGVIGIIASILSFQCSEHKKLLSLRTGNEFFFAVQYCLLGAYTGMCMNLLGCVRNIIFAKLVEKDKSTHFARAIFSLLFVIFSICTWAGFKSILISIAKVLSTYAYGSSKTGTVRVIIFFTSISWLIYNFMVKSYAGCICELFTLCSIIIGFIRFDIPKHTGAHKPA